MRTGESVLLRVVIEILKKLRLPFMESFDRRATNEDGNQKGSECEYNRAD